jgi:hypothetical protein
VGDLVAIAVSNFGLRRKLLVERVGELTLIKVGQRVSRSKLKKALSGFETVLFANGFDGKGLKPSDLSCQKTEFVFNLFASYCLSREFVGQKVGVIDRDGRFFARLIPVVNRVPCTVICTDIEAEKFCRCCIAETGACPDIVSKKSYLYDCDVVFSPEGLSGFSGVLFSQSGVGLQTKVKLPKYCDTALNLGVDPIELAAVMSAGKLKSTEN